MRDEPDDHDRAEERADAVPCRAAGSGTAPTRIATVIGTTYGSKSGVATFEALRPRRAPRWPA